MQARWVRLILAALQNVTFYLRNSLGSSSQIRPENTPKFLSLPKSPFLPPPSMTNLIHVNINFIDKQRTLCRPSYRHVTTHPLPNKSYHTHCHGGQIDYSGNTCQDDQ
jgi:hypothetical protein